MGTIRRVALLVSALGVLALPATAAADSEPNNALWQAEGPIGGGADVVGTLATRDDWDWYVFYAQPQQQLHLTYGTDDGYTDASYGSCIGIRDSDGGGLANDYTTPAGGVRRYFVRVGNGCYGPGYHFRIEPGSALTTGSPMPTPSPTGEPNESADQASGPLAGGTTYSGTIDTANDQEWFYLYTQPGTHQLDVSATGVPGTSDCSGDVRVALGDDSISPDANQVEHITRTVTGAQRLDLAVNANTGACVGSNWQFRIDPPDAVTGTPPANQTPTTTTPDDSSPPVVTTACVNARRAVKSARRDINAAVRKLKHAHGHSRKVWKHRLAAATSRLKRAQRSVRGRC